jgi:protein-disulfide isomerase
MYREALEEVHDVKRLFASAVAIFAFAAAPAWAQAPQGTPSDLSAIKSDLERIKADLEALKGQLGQVLRLLGQQRQAQSGPAAPGAPVRASIADAPVLGRPDAPVTIVEFSDYQCPFCQRFFATTFPAIKKDYVDIGKVRYVFRDFPLDQIHPLARKAAEAAHCAGEQGKYWPMHDVLYQNSKALAVAQLGEHARKIGVDPARFDECLSSGRYAARVEKGVSEGAAVGVQGTPTFVVGKTRPGDIVEGTPIRGAQPLENFRRVLDQALAEK